MEENQNTTDNQPPVQAPVQTETDYVAATKDDKKRKAIAGFVLGLASFNLSFTFVVPILGLIFSIQGAKSSQAGLAKIGKTCSIINLVLAPFMLALVILCFVILFRFFNHENMWWENNSSDDYYYNDDSSDFSDNNYDYDDSSDDDSYNYDDSSDDESYDYDDSSDDESYDYDDSSDSESNWYDESYNYDSTDTKENSSSMKIIYTANNGCVKFVLHA